ncbi:3'-5' exonuclease [Sodalis endosymbiont of Spalangia cameroni]|uniref:3'-5' exonuclease n=1 Tax=Sodalis praecaptivus TaxID=1239307 RepID=UPI0031F7DBA0
MNNVMLDIETLGKKAGCPIVSVAAVMFAPATGRVGQTFYERIDYQAALKYGEPEEGTLLWWQKQSDEARHEAFGGKAAYSHAIDHRFASKVDHVFASWSVPGSLFFFWFGGVFLVFSCGGGFFFGGFPGGRGGGVGGSASGGFWGWGVFFFWVFGLGGGGVLGVGGVFFLWFLCFFWGVLVLC